VHFNPKTDAMTQLETLLARVDSLKAQWYTARPIPAPLLGRTVNEADQALERTE
jgi:hypothetical protein